MDGQVAIAIRHNFETAHRLPFLGGKCASIHGHSWWATVNLMRYDVDGGMMANGISADFSAVKKVIRGFIDDYLDHGLMLGAEDALLRDVAHDGGKLFVFGTPPEDNMPSVDYWDDGPPWPTVEAVAMMLAKELQETFDNLAQEWGVKIWIDSVKVEEGHVNSALYVPTLEGDK